MSQADVPAIHQFVPTFVWGDAVGGNMRRLRSLFRRMGFQSEIFAQNIDERLTRETVLLERYPEYSSPRNLVLYHHATAADFLGMFARLPDRKAFTYHNVTPSHFFAPYTQHDEDICLFARNQWRELKEADASAFGASAYNCEELRAWGFDNPQVLPLLFDSPEEKDAPDPATLARMSGAETSFLFVGRSAPNKRIEDLIQLVDAYGKMFGGARLNIVGPSHPENAYELYLRRLAARVTSAEIIWHGRVSNSELAAYYATASVYVSMSDHEGYGMPLIEAMRHRVPVLAYGSGAVPETMGGAGVLFYKKDFVTLARIVRALSRPTKEREEIVAGQDRRLAALQSAELETRIETIFRGIMNEPPRSASPKTKSKKVDRPRVSFVVCRYGEQINGGAELLTRQVCERLAPEIELEVLTTRAVDHITWRNELPAGPFEINGVKGERFSCDLPRDVDRFLACSAEVFGKDVEPAVEERWLREQGPVSAALLAAIEARRTRRDLFIFATYLYWPTVMGLRSVADRSLLIPTAHDEPPIHLKMYRDVFRKPLGLIYLTEEEKVLTRSVIGLTAPSHVFGNGIDIPKGVTSDLAHAQFGKNYFLYVGRIEHEKGCPTLFEAYAEYRRQHTRPPNLVLLGRASIPIPEIEGIIAPGFVSDELKFSAIAGATAVVVPSQYESFSYATLEAMALGVPVIGNGACSVVAGHCQRSRAGLVYTSPDQLVSQLLQLASEPTLRSELGRAGPGYVEAHYTWDAVVARYLDLIRFRTEQHRRKYA